MPEMFAQPPATVRHRIEQWVDPSIEAGKDLSDVKVPILVVAGTAVREPTQQNPPRWSSHRTLRDCCHLILAPAANRRYE